jgi:uncharacterized protein
VLRITSLVVLTFILGVPLAPTATAQELQKIPPLTQRVTDLTGTLSSAEQGTLTAQLKAIEDKKGSQVAILLVPTTAPEDIASYSIRVVDAWKLGRKQVQGKAVDDGVLILLAKNDRKMRIEVGYGLEGAIPDSRAKRIIAETMAPRFRQGDFAGGLGAAVVDVARLIDGEPLPDPWLGSTKKSPVGTDQSTPVPIADSMIDWLPLVGICLFAGFVITGIFGRWFGSVMSGVGSGIFLASATASLPFAAGVGGGLFLLFLIFGGSRRRVSRVGRHTYGSTPIVIPGGGWGGGGWGGGSGGGGFSGGGGGFGGGGASGDW